MGLESNALLALTAAVLWGGGDFSGGMGVKRAGGTVGAALRVVLLSHLMSFTALSGLALLRGDAFPHGLALATGIGSGVMGGLSLTMFYIALSRGAMGTSAAVSGLLAAAIPAAVSMSREGWPGMHRVLGFVVAGAAIWLIAAGENPESVTADARTTWMAILAGAGFGIYFVGLKITSSAGLVWPMATARIGSLTTCSLVLLAVQAATRGRGIGAARIHPAVVRWAASTALLDTCGNLLFMAATRAGRLDVAAVLASLYPASTIMLAAWTLHERPTRRQSIGMVLAVAAVAMITL
ncbi:MAG: DMT family transporter [Acidobacteriota bacterium]|nr:DMT family transporter [Acidobacteriota bacterium]